MTAALTIMEREARTRVNDWLDWVEAAANEEATGAELEVETARVLDEPLVALFATLEEGVEG